MNTTSCSKWPDDHGHSVAISVAIVASWITSPASSTRISTGTLSS